MEIPITYRQGDVLFIKINDIDPWRKKYPKEDNIVLMGESTGHAHRLINGILYGNIWDMFAEVKKNGHLIHEEHGTINLLEGYYKIRRQREFISGGFYSGGYTYVHD